MQITTILAFITAMGGLEAVKMDSTIHLLSQDGCQKRGSLGL